MNSFKQKWAGYSEKKKRILTALACILCFILLLSLFIALKLARIQYDPAPETENANPASVPAETDQQFAGKGRSTVNILVLVTELDKQICYLCDLSFGNISVMENHLILCEASHTYEQEHQTNYFSHFFLSFRFNFGAKIHFFSE